jgi:O-antigen/teichoic acid export membrane protein
MSDDSKNILNALLKGAAFSIVGMFFSKAMGYVYRIIVGRYIGPEAYGQLAIGMMILGFGNAFAGGALDSALMRYMPEFRENGNKAKLKGVSLSVLQISILMSVVTGITIFLSADFLAVQFFGSANPEILTQIIQIFGLLTIFVSPTARILTATEGFNTTKYHVLTSNIFKNAAKISLTLIAVFALGSGIMGAVWSWVIATIMSTFLAFYFLERRLGPVLTADVEAEYMRKDVMIYAYPLMFSSVLGTVQGWSDTAILGYFMSETSVGLYNAALPTASLVIIPALAIGKLATTSFSELNQKEEGSGKALKTLTHWSFATVFPLSMIMILFPEQSIEIIFGKEYTSAATALAILVFSKLVSATVGNVNSFLKSKDYTKVFLYNTVFVVVVNVLLNIYLIPKLGINGAAIATAVSGIIGELLLFLETYRFEKVISLHRNMIKTLMSGTIAITATYLGLNLIFNTVPYLALIPAAGVFLTLHIIIFLKIGGLTEYDKEIIITIGNKAGLDKETRKILRTLSN